MRGRLTILAGGTVLAIGLSTFGVIANGDVPPAAAAPAPAGPTNTVTLLTGDRVTVGPDGTIVRIQRGPGRADVSFTSSQDPTGAYVIPSDAIDLVADRRLDRRLFDVRGLAESGYDGLDRQAAPVIVTYEDRARTTDLLADAGAVDRRPLDAIDAVAARPGPGTELWTTLTDDGTLADPVDKIWLDGVRQPMLDRSTKQIGAPRAWDRGLDGAGVTVAVLDSGVDRTHPDLAERVSVARNFTDEGPRDRVGHGTHVASIVAGTGVASDQTYRGVAPTANLISGKVCEVWGCLDSNIIAAMEWAAVDKGARVVNLSLGGTDRPELDPLETAINELTEQTSALFVVAAGNQCSAPGVASPASARAALAVGAVRRNDQLASFSCIGPPKWETVVKPDLTAPGVNIAAARADGTQLGEPVGDKYVRASGTSMATPHVAGSAALLAQQHPDWTADRLKAALVGSAEPNSELSPFEQGAGRVDVGDAIDVSITAEPVSLAYQTQPWPHDDDAPVEQTLTYRNSSGHPVELSFEATLTGADGAAAPDGALTLSTDTLRVPANDSAKVTVTSSTRHNGPAGDYVGAVVATGENVNVRTPIAVGKEPESYDLTVRHLDRAGKPTAPVETFAYGVDVDAQEFFYDEQRTVRLPKGTYTLSSYLREVPGNLEHKSFVALPTVRLDRDRTITVDARKAKPVNVTVPRENAKAFSIEVGFARRLPSGGSFSFGYYTAESFDGIYTGQVGPAIDPDDFVGFIGTDFAKWYSNSPYAYVLKWFEHGRNFSGFEKDVQDDELARVDFTYAKTQKQTGLYPHFRTSGPFYTGSGSSIGSYDNERVRVFFQPEGVRWSGGVEQVGPNYGTLGLLYGGPKTYRAGKTYSERWNSSVIGPAFPATPAPWLYGPWAERSGDHIAMSLPLYSDADGHSGHGRADTAHTALYRNGELIAESEKRQPGLLEADVPGDPADYRLDVTADRSKQYAFTTKLEASWRFRSGTAPDEGAPLPLAAVRFSPDVDLANLAERKPSQVPVTVETQQGSQLGMAKRLRVWVSYDDGASWTRAPLSSSPDGGKLARIDPPADAEYVSLRASVRFRTGESVEQTMIRSYGLK